MPNMPSHAAIARARYTFGGCKLQRPHIDRIWAVMVDDFSDSDNRSISTRRGILVDILAGSMDALINGIRESNEPGDPDQIDNLSMMVSTNSTANPDSPTRTIQIRIDHNGVDLSIFGEPAWARGKIDHLTSLINESRHYRSPLWSMTPKWWAFFVSGMTSLIFMSAMMALGVLPIKWYQEEQPPGLTAILLISCAIGACVGWSIGRSIQRRTRTTLWILRTPPPPSRWHMTGFEIIATMISISTLAAAIISAYAAYKVN